LLAFLLTLIWISNVGLLSGIGYALGFSFLKRFVIKATVAKYLTVTPQNSDLENATSKLLPKLNRNLFGCTLFQLFVLLSAISVNEKKVAGKYLPHPPKPPPSSVSKPIAPLHQKER